MPRRWTFLGAALVVASSLTVVSNAGRPARADTPDPVLYAAGDVAQCDGAGDEATAALIQPALAANANAAVAMLGDGTYPVGSLQWYQQCYGSAAGWGQFKARTYPATGNHDYEAPAPADGSGYFDYFGSGAATAVTAPGAPPGVYSYDLGAWHVVVLNSTCGTQGGSGVGGCNAQSPMGTWLRADLARTQAKCMIAVWHHPRFYSASKLPNLTATAADVPSHDAKMNDIWDILQKAGVDLVLSGHHHVYERMAKMDARADGTPGSGVPDPVNGMRQFVVGTGGGPYEQFIAGETDPNSEKQIEDNWGVLRLDLHATTYDWHFLSAGGPGEQPAGAVLDSGSDSCSNAATPPTTPPPATTGPGDAPLTTTPVAPHPNGDGYWMVGADGKVFGFGAARRLGDATALAAGAQAVDLEPTPSGNGYWVVDSAGKVQAFGDAVLRGMPDNLTLSAGERVTSLSATPTGGGYWIFTDRGRVLNYGDAISYGDMAKVKLNGPILDSIPTPTGHGYYMVGSDGGIFAFGDAAFYGSMGGRKLNAAVQSLVPDADGRGYWLVASDGGIFAFDAPFKGSMGGRPLAKPVTGMVRYADGYLMVGEDGGIFDFSSSPFLGSLGGNPPARPIVSVAAFGA